MTNFTLERWAAEQIAQGYSRETVRVRNAVVGAAARWCDVDPWQLTRDDVVAWLGSSERSSWTRIKYLSHVSAYAQWAGIQDPTDGVRRPRPPRGVPKPVSEVDLARLLDKAKPGRERAWVVLGAYAGLRAHESAKVCAEDLTWSAAGEPLLRVLGKGGQLAMIPLPQVVVDELRAATRIRPDGRLWPGATTHTVQRVITRLGARAGVSVSSHQLRHRYGTANYALSKDLLLTSQLMRHSNMSTTAGYAAVGADAGARLVASLPGANGGDQPRLRLVR